MKKPNLKTKFDITVIKIFSTTFGGDNGCPMFPFTEGDVYNFTLSENLFRKRSEIIDGIPCKWVEVITDEEVGISTRHIVAPNNGLSLSGKLVVDRIKSFIDLFNEDGHLTLKITKVIERNWTKPNGEDIIRKYLKLKKI